MLFPPSLKAPYLKSLPVKVLTAPVPPLPRPPPKPQEKASIAPLTPPPDLASPFSRPPAKPPDLRPTYHHPSSTHFSQIVILLLAKYYVTIKLCKITFKHKRFEILLKLTRKNKLDNFPC
jgi:hypothetical protein